MMRNQDNTGGRGQAARPPVPRPPKQNPLQSIGFGPHHVLISLLVIVLLIILGGTVRMIWQQWQAEPLSVAESPQPQPRTTIAAIPAAKSEVNSIPEVPPPTPIPAMTPVPDDMIARVLAESAFPPVGVQRIWEEVCSDAQGKWHHIGYDVTLPPDLTWPRLRSRLVANLAGNHLSVTEERNTKPGTACIRVAQQSRIIAEAVIHPVATALEPALPLLKGSEPSITEEQSSQEDSRKQIPKLKDINNINLVEMRIVQNRPEMGAPAGVEPAPEAVPVPVPESGSEPTPAPSPTPKPEPAATAAPVPETASPSPAPGPAQETESAPALGAVPVVEAAPAPEPAEAEKPSLEPQSEPSPEITAQPKAETAERVLMASAKDDRPRVAIILDDGGYGGQDTERALSLDPKVTLSILPNTPAAKVTAQRAVEKGFEVMLHMPMETAVKGVRAVAGQLDTSMNRETIHRLTLEALVQVPGAKGVNYHTGGKFIQDGDRARWFMEVVRDQKLYFVDSMTTARSAGHAMATALGVRNADRDVFLDNQNEPGYIRRQFELLEDRAKTRGAAIGIGHFRRSTISVLHDLLPKLRAHGIELVHVSELF